MGKREDSGRDRLFVPATALQRSPAHPFYDKLNEVLAAHGFDACAAERCARFYDDNIGRPSLTPGVYFHCLFLGYFEGIESERDKGCHSNETLEDIREMATRTCNPEPVAAGGTGKAGRRCRPRHMPTGGGRGAGGASGCCFTPAGST
jgi:hypothetical protein